MADIFDLLLGLAQPADVTAEILVRLQCQCGCGRITDITLEPNTLKAGGVGIWTTELIEVAVGFHCGLYEPEFEKLFEEAGHNVEEI